MSQNFMARALELARQAQGRTSPNPLVGAVVVKENQIIGEGFHRKAGQAHAEILALQQAGAEAKGATLYSTLEPCCHYGKTPPCTKAIIAAGIAKVHIAMLDPNPQVSGKGQKALEAANIETIVGERAKEASILNENFIHWITTKTPFVIAKFAMSLDGKIATKNGDSRWITSVASRTFGHKLRDQIDAILVGVDTVIADNPQLTTRLEKEDISHPLRIVVASSGRIPANAQITSGKLPGKTLVATTAKMPQSEQEQLLKNSVEVLILPQKNDQVDLKPLLQNLGERGITSLLVEGGGKILESFFASHLVNKVMAFVAPMIIGGENAPTPVRGMGVNCIKEAWRLKEFTTESISSDVLLSGYIQENGEQSV